MDFFNNTAGNFHIFEANVNFRSYLDTPAPALPFTGGRDDILCGADGWIQVNGPWGTPFLYAKAAPSDDGSAMATNDNFDEKMVSIADDIDAGRATCELDVHQAWIVVHDSKGKPTAWLPNPTLVSGAWIDSSSEKDNNDINAAEGNLKKGTTCKPGSPNDVATAAVVSYASILLRGSKSVMLDKIPSPTPPELPASLGGPPSAKGGNNGTRNAAIIASLITTLAVGVFIVAAIYVSRWQSNRMGTGSEESASSLGLLE